MPPASLPAFAAISPGPRTARSGMRRAARRLRGRSRTRPASARSRTCAVAARTERAIVDLNRRRRRRRHGASLRLFLAEEAELPPPSAGQNELEHVIDGDDAEEPL